LTTAEWVDEVRRVLKPGGLYAMNMIDLRPLSLLKAESQTLLDAFAEVQLVSFAGRDRQPFGGNAVLLASDRRIPDSAGSDTNAIFTYQRPAVESFSSGAEPLRDDYAPVDQLLTIE
jgi:hypothetical protein